MRFTLATLRGRFMALLLLGAAPLMILGAVIADQNARLLTNQSRQHLSDVRESVELRQRSFLWESERLLTALALSPLARDPAACASALGRIIAISGQRYTRLMLVDTGGTVRCGAALPADPTDSDARGSDAGGLVAPVDLPTGSGLTPAETGAAAAARATGRFAIGQIGLEQGDGPHRRAVLPVALPVAPLSGEAAGDILLASLNEARLLYRTDALLRQSDVRAWVTGPSGALVPFIGTVAGAAPAAADMDRLERAGASLIEGVSRSGARFVYATEPLAAGMRMVLAEPVPGVLTGTMRLFGWRLAQLAVVLLAGLALVAVGADLMVGRPLQRVARAVGRWRAGGRFDLSPLAGAPAEIAALAQSFAEATAALGVRERQLRDAAVQQELLMQEIHHRVKNNLQVVASLLSLQANRIRQPAARAEFHAARDRIRALATLHRHLYARGELHTINMRGFLEELCEQLLQAMGEPSTGGRIALTIEASELRISSDQAVPIALLVTEAVSNAVKYAFPGGRRGHVAVRLMVTRDAAGDESALLCIDDDGVGIPAGRSETEAGLRDGIGLKLIRGFASQLGATLTVTEEHGTHYAVRMPLRRERPDPGVPANQGDPLEPAEPARIA
jgi:two-component sensor histidine kinase